jgi:hypothetical protein
MFTRDRAKYLCNKNSMQCSLLASLLSEKASRSELSKEDCLRVMDSRDVHGEGIMLKKMNVATITRASLSSFGGT